jgi:hypothetical protein
MADASSNELQSQGLFDRGQSTFNFITARSGPVDGTEESLHP